MAISLRGGTESGGTSCEPVLALPGRKKEAMKTSTVAPIAILAVFVVLGCTGCQSNSGAGAIAGALLYAADSTTQVKPSDVFCGNFVKDSTRSCTSKATDGNGNRPAHERTEIRGWIIGVDGPDSPGDLENEYRFRVLLDYGWTPATPAADGIFPLNTPEAINAAITPHNAIFFGQNDAGNGPAMIDSNPKVWGGTRAAVLHVEVNGWGPARMGHAPPPNDWVTFAPGSAGDQNVNGGNAGTKIGWPFDPSNPLGTGTLDACDPSLANCAYVRLVGTLWEDEPHIHDGSDAQKDAKGCWHGGATGQGSFGRGYFEIHPVDFMARVQPTNPHNETLAVVAMCDSSTVDHDFFPPGPAPSAGMTVGFQELTDDSFTVWRSVTTPNVGDRVTVFPDHIHVHVHVETGGLFGHGAKFKALYRVFWH